VAHTVFTDHWIRSKPEPLVELAKPVGREIDPTRPIQLIDFWEGGEPKSPTLRALALAKYFDIRRIPNRQQPLEALELALAKDKKNSELHFWHGATLASMSRWKPALEAYQKAAGQLSDPVTLYGLGEAQRQLGLYNEAIATLSSCAEQYAAFLPTYFELAETHVGASNLKAAVDTLDRSLDLFSYQSEVAVLRAHLSYLSGEPIPRVLERVDEAMSLSPDSAALHWLMGECYASQGDSADAIRAYEKALENDARFVPALLSLGPALLQAGRINDAQTRLNQLRAIAPKHPMLPAAQQEIDRMRLRQKR